MKQKNLLILTAVIFIFSAESAMAAKNTDSKKESKIAAPDKTAVDENNKTPDIVDKNNNSTQDADKNNSSEQLQKEADKNNASKEAEPENTFDRCSDQIDNDRDSYVDCDDQDCAIFTKCIKKKPTTVIVATAEQGAMCSDGIDNDKNGDIDCHDTKCFNTKYCIKKVYYRETPKNKPQGLIISSSLGLAIPNFNWTDVRAKSSNGKNIPFDPDMGVMSEFKIGFVPVKWFGFGFDFNSGATFASNEEEYFLTGDSDKKYKYEGIKGFIKAGGFIRLQFPTKIAVPRLDVGMGFSHVRYRWYLYKNDASWDDIGNGWEDSNDKDLAQEIINKKGTDLYVTVEPGIDFFIIPRFFAIGISARLPVFSSNNSGMINIGALVTATVTPMWREPVKLKKEYRKYSSSEVE